MTVENPHKPQMRLKKWVQGERITADGLNQAVNIIARFNRGVRPPSQIVSAGKGTETGINISPFRVYEIRRDYLKCVPISTTNVTVETRIIYVARPYLLRRTPFDNRKRNGISYDYSGLDPRDTSTPQTRLFTEDHVTRLAERPGLGRDGVGTILKEREVQAIMPIYYTFLSRDISFEDDVEPDIIFAANLDANLIDMKTEPPDLEDIDGVLTPIDIVWLDLNVDGRAWQAIFVEAIHSTMVG